jgi:hypothetical protein
VSRAMMTSRLSTKSRLRMCQRPGGDVRLVAERITARDPPWPALDLPLRGACLSEGQQHQPAPASATQHTHHYIPGIYRQFIRKATIRLHLLPATGDSTRAGETPAKSILGHPPALLHLATTPRQRSLWTAYLGLDGLIRVLLILAYFATRCLSMLGRRLLQSLLTISA